MVTARVFLSSSQVVHLRASSAGKRSVEVGQRDLCTLMFSLVLIGDLFISDCKAELDNLANKKNRVHDDLQQEQKVRSTRLCFLFAFFN